MWRLSRAVISAGTLARGPKAMRDSILVQEDMWFGMDYLKQIAFVQSFECAYLDVRSLATGRLLATWMLGELKPAE